MKIPAIHAPPVLPFIGQWIVHHHGPIVAASLYAENAFSDMLAFNPPLCELVSEVIGVGFH